MQKLLLFSLLIVITSLSACAQQSHLDKFYQKYHASDGITISSDSKTSDGTRSAGSAKTSGNISIDPSFLLSATFSGNGSDADNNWMKKITNLRVLILDGEKTPSAQQQWTELEQALQQDGFDDLLTIRKGKDRMRLLLKEGEGGIKQMAFLVAGKEGGGLFFHFRGHFTEKDMARIQSALQEHDSQ